jgi:adenylate cyclase
MLEIVLHNARQHRQFRYADGPLTLARVDADSSIWNAIDRSHSEHAHAIVEIAPRGDGIAVAMKRCEVDTLDDHFSRTMGVWLLPVPARFAIGDTRFEIIDSLAGKSRQLRGLEKLRDRNTRATRSASAPYNRRQSKDRASEILAKTSGPSPGTLSQWFAALGTLNRRSNCLQESFVEAAKAAVDAIGLDGAMIVRRRDQQWEIVASHLPHPELGIHCELDVLDQLLQSPETLFQGANSAADSGLEPSVVVSPIRNAAGQLGGAIYGYRSVRAGNGRRGIRYLEAHLIELLASAVSDTMARIEHEAESERRRVLLDQIGVMTNERDPRQLASHEREVTMLFADLRECTRFAESLDVDLLCELLGQVMDCLTAAVMDHDGLVIDYYGDGLAAMWNAPAQQAEHPELACRAALAMLTTLPEVAADWAEVLETQLRPGIGVHTGRVQVGNAGSRQRAKYGPRGPNVHLTSRLEKATKEWGVPLLVSGSTASRLSNRLHARPLGHAQLAGFEEPIHVYTIETSSRP